HRDNSPATHKPTNPPRHQRKSRHNNGNPSQRTPKCRRAHPSADASGIRIGRRSGWCTATRPPLGGCAQQALPGPHPSRSARVGTAATDGPHLPRTVGQQPPTPSSLWPPTSPASPTAHTARFAPVPALRESLHGPPGAAFERESGQITLHRHDHVARFAWDVPVDAVVRLTAAQLGPSRTHIHPTFQEESADTAAANPAKEAPVVDFDEQLATTPAASHAAATRRSRSTAYCVPRRCSALWTVTTSRRRGRRRSRPRWRPRRRQRTCRRSPILRAVRSGCGGPPGTSSSTVGAQGPATAVACTTSPGCSPRQAGSSMSSTSPPPTATNPPLPAISPAPATWGPS
ncbi:UNVERIFIED_CONTAM: hypothetical protein RKD43_007032, partial [Streptomyces graminofaciens]